MSTAIKHPKVDDGVQAVFEKHMRGTFVAEDRSGLTQALVYECINLAAVGSNNVWMHFQKRVLSYVRSCFAMEKVDYDKLTKQEKKDRKLALLQVADDVCRRPDSDCRSPLEYHEWIGQERDRLGIDAAVGNWNDKPLLYHLKAKPHRFIPAMYTMSTKQLSLGRKALALFPLRRSHVPGHMRFDKKVLDDLLGLGCAAAAANAKKKQGVDLNSQPVGPSGRAPKRKRDDPTLLQEKAEVFNQVLDLRAAGVHRRHHFCLLYTSPSPRDS